MLRSLRVLLCGGIAFILSLTFSANAGCPTGDVHQDAGCEVNWLDLQDFAQEWLNAACAAPGCRADLDGVPGVNMPDFAVLAGHWGETGSITLVINELMADNEGTIEDPDEFGEYADWIEIYNYGDDPIDMGGMYLTDEPLNQSSWLRIPTDDPEKTTIEPGGYLVFWADDDTEQGALHLNFKIAADGDEDIGLFDWYKNPLDIVEFDAQNPDESWGRLPDGTNNWVTFEVGGTTPGYQNRGKPIEILISEIMYHPGHAEETPENIGQEYIELYNQGDDPVSLAGWRFSDGVDFTIPDGVILPAGEYLVVASDVNEFTAKYPSVTNYVGGWTGRLSNSGEQVELVDNAGVLVDRVEYSDQGEWAVRELGPVDYGHRGWDWSEAHDGGGESLELINPALSNDYGQNFSASQTGDGTPGALNTVNDDDVGPLVLDVEHYPIIPDDGHPVTVTAQIIDESSSGVSVAVRYRVDTSSYEDEDIYPHHDPNDYSNVPMYDDGAHGDGDAADGVYGGAIPPQANGSVVEFYVESSDAGDNTRTWPAPSIMRDGTPEQVTNALYQVNNAFDIDTWIPGSQPVYYLIFTEMEKGRLLDIGDRDGGEYNSDAQMNITFVSVDGVEVKARYNCGIRNRGHGSRNDPPNNYRVNFPHDRKWEGVDSINLNTKNTYIQLTGNLIGRLSGLPQPRATAVQVRLNGENRAESGSAMYGSYVHMEVVDSDFVSSNFPDDEDGDAYKCMRDAGAADFGYDGTDPDDYRYSYLKRTNTAADDFSRLIEACYSFDTTPDSTYVEEVRRTVNVENWMLYFAINALMENNETSLANGYGDDYYTYQGIVDTRFVLIAHDLDSVFGFYGSSATQGIFRASGLQTIKRFIEHPKFVGRYYYHLKKLIETTFSAERFDPFLDEILGDFVSEGTIQGMKDFVAQRNAHVMGLIPLDFSINSDFPVVDGYHRTTTDSFTLSGTANSIETRSVLVNGQLAEWSPVDGTWDSGGAAGVSETIIEQGSDWKYLDDGSDGGTSADGLDWYAHPDYDDSSWSEGPAELGYGDASQGYPEATEVNSGPDGAHYITTYFRRTFDANEVSRYSSLQIGVMADDGAALYLNGVEIENARSNLPEGDIDYLTTALVNIGQEEERTFYYYPVDVSRLDEGTNVIAVEIHQLAPDNPDISFDLELLGILPAPGDGSLKPGINRIIVQAFDGPNGGGSEVDNGYIDIWYDTGRTTDYPGGEVPEGPVRLIVRDSYLPGIPMLIRVEAVAGDGTIDRDLWDAVPTLSVDDNPGIALSVNEVKLYNGRGSELVTFTGSGDFTLTADIGGIKDTRSVTDLIGEPITVVSQPLSSSETWDGIYYVTGGDLRIPAGMTLTLNPGAMVLIDGTSTPLSQNGIDIDVEGALNSLGTKERPVTITAANPYAPWGEIHHSGEASTYQYTNITRAGHSPHSGHTSKGPAMRVDDATITFDNTAITDIAGKTMYANNAALEFSNCLFSRSVMGPEIFTTAFLFEDSHIIEMLGIYREDGVTDDDDGIYPHGAGAGKDIKLIRSVVAVGDDDGIDTLDAIVTIEDVIVRDFGDKGISVFGGEATISRCLVVENNKKPEDPTVVSIGAKAHSGGTTIVNMDHTTVVASEVTLPTVDVGIQSHNKYGETSGEIIWNVTNCIIDATDPVDFQAPYLESDIHISYSDLFDETWTGTGNITGDPMFVSRSNHNYNLQAGSPCIDTGDPEGADMGALPYSAAKEAKASAPGELAGDTVWTAADGPYRIIGDLTIPLGVTLTIEPGVTVFFEPDTKIIINGTLAADGLEYQSIRFTSTPGASGPWNGLQFIDTGTDNRISHAVLEYGQTNDGMIGAEDSNLLIEHSTLDHTERRRIRTLDTSLIVRDCWFTDIFEPGQPPSTDNMSEHIWGRAGDTGWFIIENNVFGLDKGHNDAIDVDGPSRPNPIPQILNNTFLGSGDDALDLESDAHIEGNKFYNIIKDEWNTASGEANVISAGSGRHYVMARNVFYNIQHIAQVKDDAFMTFVNNTVVEASEPGIYFDLDLPGRDPGRGADVDGTIFWGVPEVFAGVEATTELTVDNTMIPFAWHSYGAGNIDADPLLVDDTGDFSLKADSGAIGAGSWGLDMGASVPAGAAISGEPYAVTYHTTATLTVGGPGITDYKYSLNNPTGPWSAEISVDVPIVLTGLSNGQAYTVYAIGKNSAGVWQSEDSPAVSHTWNVDTSHSDLLINEVLAHTHGADPDIIELYYDGPGSLDLTGMSLTDDPADPAKFEFNSGTVFTTTMYPGNYMILYGDLTTVTNHLGFALSADGEALYLYDKPNPDGTRDLIDSVEFGPQINDYTIGRVGWDRQWKLNQMTFASANIAQPLGDPYTLKINEWLANGQVLFDDDFVELYNPHPHPVALGGLYMTDNPVTQPDKHRIVPLSFIPGEGYSVFRVNDGNDPSELDFKLSADGEMIGLFDSGLTIIDQVLYGPQTTDVSQGLSPDGSSNYEFFELPTPGVANTSAPVITTTTTVLAAEDATKWAIVPTSPNDVGGTWNSDPDFDDSTWMPCIGGPGGVGFETGTGYESLITLDVESPMDGNNTTCYIRIPFTVDLGDLADFTDMTLKIRYDDGFVPYINGVDLVTARRNFAGPPDYNSVADSDHPDSVAMVFENIGISSYLSALEAGDNVLAIHGLNGGITSSDFLISAELEAAITTIDYGEFPYPDALDQLAGLRITEVMYNHPRGSNYDYIELQNISGAPIQIGGVRFLDGIEFEFPSKLLGAGQYVVVVSNLTTFRNFYGYTADVAGQYTGGLSGGGEGIVLALPWPLDAAIMRFEYSDTWYPTTDGSGDSLTINDATVHPFLWNEPDNWHAAPPSPGAP